MQQDSLAREQDTAEAHLAVFGVSGAGAGGGCPCAGVLERVGSDGGDEALSGEG
jgi:hypothetical protein